MAKLQPAETPTGRATVEAARPGLEYQTTYRRGVVLLWHACGKSVEVSSGKVTDDLYTSHVCGPHGTPWDRER